MNRLWVRLSLAFAAYAVVAGLLLVASGLLLGRDVRRSPFGNRFREPGGLVDALAARYQDAGGWSGVEPLLTGAQAAAPPGMVLVLLGPDGEAVVPVASLPRAGQPALNVVPIQVDGREVGRLAVWPAPGGPPDIQGRLEQGLMFLGLLAGVLGVVFGIAVSRGVTAPLERLAEAAHAIGHGELGRRVEVGGGAELAEVGLAFNQMALSLEQAELRRRDLVAEVAHELRTPVSVLQANLQAMLDGVFGTEPAEIGRLYDQTRLLGRLVGDLEDLARADAGQLTLHRAPTDLGRLARETAATVAPVADAAGIQLTVETAPDLPLLDADAGRLAQVLNNLLVNAFRHTGAGGHVALRVARDGAGVVLEVADDGEGINPADLPFVFDRFFRSDPARRRAKGGAGLGLPIARALVLAHGGQIALESPGPGQGARALVRLPAAR
jgi:signal transduction histidine kinase